MASVFQQKQTDGDNKKTCCSSSVVTSLFQQHSTAATEHSSASNGNNHGRKKRKGRAERVKEEEARRKKEEEREVKEGGSEQVKKDVTDWTVVSRSKKQKRMIQIYVKVDDGKVIPTEVNLTDDKVEDVMRQIPNSEDAYVTTQGRVLKRSEKLKSCGVTDGCTIQVTSRGGRHKDKKRKESAKIERTEHRVDQKDDGVGSVTMDSAQPMEERPEQRWPDEGRREKTPVMRECDNDTVIQMIEQNEVHRKLVESISASNDFEVEWMVQEYMRDSCETLGWSNEQAEMMECGIRWAVEARRKGRGEEKEQRRQEEQEQRRREEHLEETRAESTDEPKVTSRVAEMKTGRGSASLVQGRGGRT